MKRPISARDNDSGKKKAFAACIMSVTLVIIAVLIGWRINKKLDPRPTPADDNKDPVIPDFEIDDKVATFMIEEFQ